MTTVGNKGSFFGSPKYHNPGPFIEGGRLINFPGMNYPTTDVLSDRLSPPGTSFKYCCRWRVNYSILKFFDPTNTKNAMVICTINSCACRAAVPSCDDLYADMSSYNEWRIGDGSQHDLDHQDIFNDILPKGTFIKDLWQVRQRPLCECYTECEFGNTEKGTDCTCEALPGFEADGQYEETARKRTCMVIQSFGKGKNNPFEGLYEDSRYSDNLDEKTMDEIEGEFLRKHIGFAPCVHCEFPNA